LSRLAAKKIWQDVPTTILKMQQKQLAHLAVSSVRAFATLP
jgi:hypothetical protein